MAQHNNIEQEQSIADWKAVLATPAGVRVLAGILVSTGLLQSVNHGPDTHTAAFQAGQRSIGANIIDNIKKAAPDALSGIFGGR